MWSASEFLGGELGLAQDYMKVRLSRLGQGLLQGARRAMLPENTPNFTSIYAALS
jgi:hypothetical protein